MEEAEPQWMRVFRQDKEESEKRFLAAQQNIKNAQEKSGARFARADEKFEKLHQEIKTAQVQTEMILAKQNKFENETKENFVRVDQNIIKLAKDFEIIKEKIRKSMNSKTALKPFDRITK